MTDEAREMILWTFLGGAIVWLAFGLGLSYILGGAAKLGGSQDAPVQDCEHGVPLHACFVCHSSNEDEEDAMPVVESGGWIGSGK